MRTAHFLEHVITINEPFDFTVNAVVSEPVFNKAGYGIICYGSSGEVIHCICNKINYKP